MSQIGASATASSFADTSGTFGDIGERLRNAAAFEPRDLPGLSEMASQWADEAEKRLAAVAGGPVSFTLEEVDSDEEPDAGKEGTRFALVSSRRSGDPGFVCLDPAFLENLIAVFFHADPQPDETGAREPTDLDRSLLSLALATIAEAGSAAFGPIGDPALGVGDIVAREALVEQLGEDPARFVCFRFTLRAGAQSVPLRFGLPETLFVPHRRLLSRKPAMPAASGDRDEAWQKAIEESFAMSDLRLEAVLARKKVPLSTIAGFEVGDTIALDIDSASLIAVACEDRQLFRARMGRSRESYVMRIEERIDPAEEFIDDILSD